MGLMQEIVVASASGAPATNDVPEVLDKSGAGVKMRMTCADGGGAQFNLWDGSKQVMHVLHNTLLTMHLQPAARFRLWMQHVKLRPSVDLRRRRELTA